MTKITITRMNPVPTWTTHTSGGYEDHDSNHTAMKFHTKTAKKKTMGRWKMYLRLQIYGVISGIYANAKGYISLWT